MSSMMNENLISAVDINNLLMNGHDKIFSVGSGFRTLETLFLLLCKS